AATFSTLGDLTSAFVEQVRAMSFSYGHGLPGRVWKSGDVIWVPDLLEETSMARATLAVDSGLHSILLFPLRDAERRIGVIELFARAVRPINDDSVTVMKYTGAAIGRLVHRQRTEEERMRLHRVIERKGNEWALTFDAIESPIFLLTVEGVIVRVNRSARDLIDLPFADIVGKSIADFGIGEPWTTLIELVAAVRDSHTPCSAQISGHEKYWDVNATVYQSEEAEEARLVIVMRDMTTLVQLQEFVRVGEQMSALGELVAGVAHEVRNPLFGMSATLEAYQPSLAKTGEALEFFAALRHWIGRLNTLMENLLEYGKSWNVNLRDGQLEDVVIQAVESCRLVAADVRVEIVNKTTDEHLVILMDPPRLATALQNLIINAIQHSPKEGTVTVEARRTEEGGTPSIECIVQDAGPGFPARDLGKIFLPFFTRRRGGTGLGLSIVQRVIEEHGGSVAAANRESGGAILRVKFPVFLR
ncbi:MAG TPA: ATP-binding protein, partial [Thermoanaerobaculia bacterium]